MYFTQKASTVLPSFIYGPFPPKFIPLPKPEYNTLSSTLVIYNLLFPTGDHLPSPSYIDVRDAACAHIGALESKPDKNNNKRVILCSPHGLTARHVLGMIKKKYPELEHRLARGPVPEFPSDRFEIDFERVKEVTGMREEDFHTLEEVCYLLQSNNLWA